MYDVDRASLQIFADAVTRADAEIDLARAALLIAEPEYAELDVDYYISLLDGMGAMARRRSSLSGTDPHHSLYEVLYLELGFTGNTDDYYDPRNSFLNHVIDRRIGIPVTLAVVLLEVARRAGAAAQGIGFPGHFLVQLAASSGPVLVDPFTGMLLGRPELRQLMARVSGDERDPDPTMLVPVTKRQILIRMLNNLRAIYNHRGDSHRHRQALERMFVLSPQDASLRRDLEALGGTIYVPAAAQGTRSIN